MIIMIHLCYLKYLMWVLWLQFIDVFLYTVQLTHFVDHSVCTEPIVKCYTILEMGSLDLSPHTFGSGLRFFKGLQKGFKKNWTYFLPRESLIGCNKNLCRPLKTFICVSLRYIKRCVGSVEIVVVVCGKICGNMCGKMCGKIEKLVW